MFSCATGGGLCCVSSLAALQQLHVRSMSAHAINSIFNTGQQQQQAEEAAVAVPVLPQLTQLQLSNVYYPEALPCLSSLTRLKELHVGLSSSDAVAHLAHLPQSLTRLEVVHAPATEFDSSCVLTQGFAQLTGLRHLQLSRVACVQPLLLSGMVQMTHLQLSVAHCSSEQLEQLLQVLPSMRQLQLLHVESWGQPWHGAAAAQPPLAAQQLTALLSSTQLRSVVLPAAAGQHLFPPGRQLPGLRQLVMNYYRRAAAPGQAATAGEEAADAAAAAAVPPLSADDVASLACCCPGLQELQLAGVLQQGLLHTAHLAALSSLPGLSRVLLDGQPWEVGGAGGAGSAQPGQPDVE
jgi:hypothetical protein